ncbi:MAG: hypothetical protein ACW99U_06390 [Candidatus Thorarchaeota archaeon]
MAVGIALIIGSELIRSATDVVWAWKLGNAVPLMLIVGSTVFILRLSAHFDRDTVVGILFSVIGWASAIFLAFTVLLIALPYGLVAALPAGATVVVACIVVQDPSWMFSGLNGSLRGSTLQSPMVQSILSAVPRRKDETVWDRVSRLPLRVLVLPDASKEKVVTVLRERMKLPVAFVHLEDSDFMLVNVSKDTGWLPRVERVLDKAGVIGVRRASFSLEQAVIGLPLIEQGHGVSLEDYCFIDHKESVDRLLKEWSTLMTVFPSMVGPVILLTEESAPGLMTKRIPRTQIQRVVLGRDITGLRLGVGETGDSA